MSETIEALLRAVLSVTGRQVFPPDRLIEIVLSKGAGEKQLRAFNMWNGAKGQADIAKALKLDSGNFSRTVSRWIDEGIVFRLAEGRDAKLLHVYALLRRLARRARDRMADGGFLTPSANFSDWYCPRRLRIIRRFHGPAASSNWKRTKRFLHGSCSGSPRWAWSKARRSALTRRHWKRTRRCGASCAATPARVIRTSSRSWRRSRASRRPRVPTCRGSIGSARRRARTTIGPIRTIPTRR